MCKMLSKRTVWVEEMLARWANFFPKSVGLLKLPEDKVELFFDLWFYLPDQEFHGTKN